MNGLRCLLPSYYSSRQYRITIMCICVGLLVSLIGGIPVYADDTAQIPNITGVVFKDSNGNGIQDGDEPGIANVTVTLEDDEGIIASTTTSTQGEYGFASRIEAADRDYYVRVTVPTGYASTTPESVTLVLNGPDPVQINFGLQPLPGTISGVVFIDVNGNGALNPGEPGLPGVTVALDNAQGTQIGTAITNALGEYTFGPVPSDAFYTVRVLVPFGYINTSATAVDVSVAPGGIAVVNFGLRHVLFAVTLSRQ